MAFSNQPFALPTMACAWVMLGNAPTRITVVLPDAPSAGNAAEQNQAKQSYGTLFILGFPALETTMDNHGRRPFSSFFFAFFDCRTLGWRFVIDNQVGQGGVFQDLRRGIAHVEEHLVKGAMLGSDQSGSQLIGIAERSQRAVDQTDDFRQVDFRRRTPQR